jgi:hypothetical protein
MRDDSFADTRRSPEIAGAQQDILREVFETNDLSDVPQLWCLYKEVQSYYLDGVSLFVAWVLMLVPVH